MGFGSEVQFGHAGSLAQSTSETSKAKNAALASAGAIVPETFNDLGNTIGQVYSELLAAKVIVPAAEPMKPVVPMDYSWANELGLVRKPTAFTTTIVDDR